MTLSELLPGIQSLPRGEKLHLIQLLAADVAQEEQLTAGWKGSQIEIWTPYNSDEAAQVLLAELGAEKANPS